MTAHPLGHLIQTVQDANQWSDRDLGERAARLGVTGIAKSNFSRLKNQPLVSVKGSLVRALALVLGVSEQTVGTAALASMGVRTADPKTLEEYLAADARLSQRDRRVIAAMVAEMRGA